MTADSHLPTTPTDQNQEKTLTLQDFLKLEGLVETGGEAKFRIQNGEVLLNGEIETRRRKKLYQGDIIEIHDVKIEVNW